MSSISKIKIIQYSSHANFVQEKRKGKEEAGKRIQSGEKIKIQIIEALVSMIINLK